MTEVAAVFADGGAIRVNPSPYGGTRMAMTLGRLGQLQYVQLDGHPTKANLRAGVGKRGNPVSRHNAWCDRECARVGQRFLLEIGRFI